MTPLLKKIKKIPIKNNKTEKKEKNRKKEWLKQEGKLAVDVYQTDEDLVIQAPLAGVIKEDLDISLEKDLITIRGERKRPIEEKREYFYQECYWGPFSREIILPVEVDPTRVTASMRKNVLTIRMPKLEREKRIKIKLKK